MKSMMFRLSAVAVILFVVGPLGRLCAAESEGKAKMLSHDVFFSLTEKTPEAKAKLIAACKKYLSDAPGVVWFAAGPLAPEFDREVNDREFDVALHIVFHDKAAHDVYQKSEKHVKFVEENGRSFAKVRVFDSYVDAFAHGGESKMPATKPAK